MLSSGIRIGVTAQHICKNEGRPVWSLEQLCEVLKNGPEEKPASNAEHCINCKSRNEKREAKTTENTDDVESSAVASGVVSCTLLSVNTAATEMETDSTFVFALFFFFTRALSPDM